MSSSCSNNSIFEHGVPPHEAISRTVIASALVIFMAAACWLLGRHLWGALRPLSLSTAFAASIAGSLVVALGRWNEWRCQRRVPKHASLRNWLFTITLLIFAVALSFPRLAPIVTMVLWLPIVVEEAAWWICWRRFRDSTQPPAPEAKEAPLRATTPRKETVDAESFQDPLDDEEFDEEECDVNEEVLPPTVTQQLIREQTENGGEYLYGLLRCKLEAGEQSQNVHVAFCPPLETIPDIVVRQLEGPNANAKIGVAQTFGARFELRLSSVATEPTEVILQFEARSKAN